ncbi:hypothetical protein ACIRSS_11135 [Amycolatopsis sp. NPDC101161]|uniref:hypothetical protein n=1 Tax=Amycolatopsis sp. NPDC101161 TaxID=3363940 RepID=UPI0037FAF1A8
MAFGLLVGGLVLLLGQNMSDQLIAAVLAFLGVLVTYAAAIISASVQRQAQDKLSRQHEQTETRLAHDAEDEKRHFELDAAMRAGQLIASANGVANSPAALASGLVTLTNLNQAELAVSLLVDLWSVQVTDDGTRHDNDRCQVANEIAILVINGALSSECRTAQLMAAELLCRNATRLTSTQSLHWPAVIDGVWRPEFAKRTKLLLVEALVDMTTCPRKPADEAALRAIAVRLHGVWRDPESKVKACVGKLIHALLPALQRCKSREFAHAGVMVKFEQLERAAGYPSDNSDGYLSELSDRLAARLAEWAAGAIRMPTDPGCLAAAG